MTGTRTTMGQLAQGIILAAVLGVAATAFGASLPYGGSDLRLWLKADGNLTLDTVNYPDRVITWHDETGLGGNTTANDGTGPSGARPLWEANQINGLPAVWFDGGGNNRRIEGSSFLSGSDPRTIFVVGHTESGATGNRVLFDPNGQGAGATLFRMTPEMGVRFGNGNSLYTSAPLGTSFAIVGASLPAGGTIGDTGMFYNSATLLTADSQSSPGNAVNTGTSGYRIGTPNSGEKFVGQIAEVLAFQGELTLAQRDAVGFYLQQKYALASSFSTPPKVFFDNLDPTDNDWQRGANWDTAAEPITGQDAYIGDGLTAKVTQSGEVADNVFVGHNEATLPGQGTLQVDSGDLTTGDLNLGNGGQIGNVTQDGGTVTVTGDLNYGATGNWGGTYTLNGGTLHVIGDVVERVSSVDTAQLYVDGGALVVDGSNITVQSLRTGDANGSTGSYTLDGGKTLDNTGTVMIGRQGTGTLNIDGSTTTAIVSNRLDVGRENSGDGTVNLLAGSLDVTNGIFLGGVYNNSSAGSHNNTVGRLNIGIGGGNPTLDTRGKNFEVGRHGTGIVQQDSGTVTVVNNNLILAQLANSHGTYTMNGGTLNTANQIRVGNTGNGIFVQNGGDVNVGTILDMGNSNNANTDGTYTLNNGTLTVGGAMYVGRLRKGTLNFVDGTLNFGNTLYLGGDPSGTGTFAPNADGTLNLGSATTAPTLTTGQFEIGRHGVGVMNHINGTVNVATGNLVITQFDNTTGDYDLAAGTVNVTNDLNFNRGAGTFTQNGGTVNVSGKLAMANQNVAGSNAIYNLNAGELNTRQFEVGVSRLGTVNQAGGAVNIDGRDNLVIGQNGSGDGTYNLMAGTLTIGTPAPNGNINFNTGTGLFHQTGGTASLQGGTINMSNGGGPSTVTLDGGLLELNGGDLDYRGGTGTFNLNGGTFDLGSGSILPGGSATFNFNGGRLEDAASISLVPLLQNGGTLAPGGSAGVTAIAGDYFLSNAATLEIELGAPGVSPGTDYDLVTVNGIATLNGILNVLAIGGFSPAPQSFFDVLTANSIDVGGLHVVSGQTGLDWRYDIINGTILRLTTIPEPGTAGLLFMGLVALSLSTTRRRAGTPER